MRMYTCVNSVKLPVCALSIFTPKDRKIGWTVRRFEMFYFELLDPEILTNNTQKIYSLELLVLKF